MTRLWDEPIFWLAALAGGFGAMLASIPMVIYALMGMMAIDIAVGLLTAAINGEINARKAWRGGLRKAVVLGVVGAAALMQLEMALVLQTNVAPWLDVPSRVPFAEFTAGVFIAYEFISILENAVRAGVRLPQPLTKMLEAGQEDAQ